MEGICVIFSQGFGGASFPRGEEQLPKAAEFADGAAESSGRDCRSAPQVGANVKMGISESPSKVVGGHKSPMMMSTTGSYSKKKRSQTQSDPSISSKTAGQIVLRWLILIRALACGNSLIRLIEIGDGHLPTPFLCFEAGLLSPPFADNPTPPVFVG